MLLLNHYIISFQNNFGIQGDSLAPPAQTRPEKLKKVEPGYQTVL